MAWTHSLSAWEAKLTAALDHQAETELLLHPAEPDPPSVTASSSSFFFLFLFLSFFKDMLPSQVIAFSLKNFSHYIKISKGR